MSLSVPLRLRRTRRAPGASRRAAYTAPAIACLGPADTAGPGAAAVALRLRSRTGSACALVATVGPPPRCALRRAARREAARAVESLNARDIRALATGRLVVAGLESAAQIARAAAVVAGPAVLLVTAPREDPLDELLADADALVLALPSTADPTVRALAGESLVALGRPVLELPPAGLLARTAALAGAVVLDPLARTADEAAEVPARERAPW